MTSKLYSLAHKEASFSKIDLLEDMLPQGFVLTVDESLTVYFRLRIAISRNRYEVVKKCDNYQYMSDDFGLGPVASIMYHEAMQQHIARMMTYEESNQQ